MVYRIENLEKNASRHCYICSGKSNGIWRLVGYDEYGELWICQSCFDKLPSEDHSYLETDSVRQEGD
jgi:hypothetical protein